MSSDPMPAATALPRSRIFLGAAFLGAAVLQVVRRDVFMKLVPPALTRYQGPMTIGAEVLLTTCGVSFLVPRLRLLARWLPIAFLTATLPPAVDQIRHPEQLEAAGLPPRLAPVRVVAQLGVIGLTWWATRDPAETDRRA